MTDRELLEAAAKAAGLLSEPHDWQHGVLRLSRPSGAIYWNPLNYDGDALRLATQLRIDLCFEKTHSVSAYTEGDEWFHEHCDQGNTEQIIAKTRRAIVRAAASIAPSEFYPMGRTTSGAIGMP